MTRRVLVLIGHSLRRVRAALMVLAILLAGFQFLLTQVAAYLMRRNGFSQLSDFIPDFIRTAVGPEGLAFMSFGGVGLARIFSSDRDDDTRRPDDRPSPPKPRARSKCDLSISHWRGRSVVKRS